MEKIPSIEASHIVEVYQQLGNLAATKRSVGRSPGAIARIVRDAGIPVRPLCEVMRRYVPQDDVFAQLNDEVAYWVGMILADGCITPPHRLRLVLDTSDSELLLKFRDFLGLDEKRYLYTHQTCQELSCCSDQIVSDLMRLGVLPRKSWENFTVAPSLLYYPSFLLGLMDGDGSITWHRSAGRVSPKVVFIGCEKLMYQVSEAIRAFADLTYSPAVGKKASIYRVAIVGRPAQRLLKSMYKSSPISLERKRKRAEVALAWSLPGRTIPSSKAWSLPGRTIPSSKATLTCAYCGAEISRWPSVIKNQGPRGFFCNATCWHRSRERKAQPYSTTVTRRVDHEIITGKRLTEESVRLMREYDDGGGLHYADIITHLEQEGFVIKGKDQSATIIQAFTKKDSKIRSLGHRSGRYTLQAIA